MPKPASASISGFFSAFGYWASACVGNVTYWVLIMSTLGKVAPGLGEGDTIVAILLSSVALWGFFFFISRGVQEATAVNRIVTIVKMVPIAVFIILALFYLKPDVYVENFSGTDRKSTRLNSSHVAISYAVFCLKT